MTLEVHAQDLIAAMEKQRNELLNTAAMLLAQDAAKSRSLDEANATIAELRKEVSALSKALADALPDTQPEA